MYMAIDIGGTKTLIAVFDSDGVITSQQKFPTNHSYPNFIKDLRRTINELATEEVRYACVAAPGKIDRQTGIALAFGNLNWKDIPLAADISKILGCPVLLENDVKLAALSEARQPEFRKFESVIYLTVSTGISDGLVVNGIIDPNHADSEAGHMILGHNGRTQTWESFASGKAIVRRFGKRASDISDPAIWKIIAHDIASGLINVIAEVQPDLVVIGGGVGSHFALFGDFLKAELKKYQNPMVTIPPIEQAKHPEEAVIYGCFEFIKDHANATARVA